VWSTAGKAVRVAHSYTGFVMKSILPKPRYPSARVQLCLAWELRQLLPAALRGIDAG